VNRSSPPTAPATRTRIFPLRPRRLPILLLTAGAAALAPIGAAAQHSPGGLLVTPTRIVFAGRQRTAEITLINTGPSPATYRITLVHLRMNETGGTQEIEPSDAHPGELFADDLIRYSPRQVTLQPQVAQTVRMQVRKPADLAPGEYRSHLLFRAVPAAEPAGKGQASAGLSIKLTAVFGVSIPVIVRHGETSAQVTLSDLAIVPPQGAPPQGAAGVPELRFRMNRTGNQSVYGNLTATFLPARGQPVVVGIANGVAVYTPNPLRIASIPLRTTPGIVLTKGLLHLAYTRHDKAGETIAEADLRVP
jgi:P pilus assembly chaperone PapD